MLPDHNCLYVWECFANTDKRRLIPMRHLWLAPPGWCWGCPAAPAAGRSRAGGCWCPPEPRYTGAAGSGACWPPDETLRSCGPRPSTAGASSWCLWRDQFNTLLLAAGLKRAAQTLTSGHGIIIHNECKHNHIYMLTSACEATTTSVLENDCFSVTIHHIIYFSGDRIGC